MGPVSDLNHKLLQIFRSHLRASGVPDDHILVMEFDRIGNEPYLDPHVFIAWIHERMTDEGNYYILLDEVQLLPRFEAVLNSLLHEENTDIYVTGSNARFLSTDVVTEFRGRGDEVHIYPLSFSEFMQVYEGDMYHGWAQ